MTGGKNMSRENRWWTVISGASRFINDIVDAVRDGNSVIIKNSGSIPFYDDMLNNIYHQVGSDMYDRTIKSFDHSRICSGSLEEYLCENCCPDEIYIPSKGFTRLHFLVRSNVFEMNNSIQIIDRPDNQFEQEWIRFVCDYCRVSSKEDTIHKAQFILLVDTDRSISKAKMCRVIDYCDYVSEYDYYVFCLLSIPDSFEKNMKIKQYISEILSDLCLDNPSLIYDLLADPKEIYMNTYQYYNSFVSNKMSENEINKVLWKAQTKIVFPVLESYRCSLAEKYRKELETQLPYKTQFGAIISEADGLELGHILNINNTLKFLSNNEYSKVKCYKAVRDLIAHMKPADAFSIENILLE